MEDAIEFVIESPAGIIDCRLEPVLGDEELYYSATILYPGTVNGFSRSEIYCHDMRQDQAGNYRFDAAEEVLPKIKILEAQLAAAIKDPARK